MADQFPPPRRAGAGNPLLAPAIALLVVGIPGALGSALYIVLTAVGATTAKFANPLAAPQQQFGEELGVALVIAMYGFGLLASSAAVAGAIAMLRGRPLALGWAGAVGVMMNPACCCCVPGIGVGIWTMIALARHQAEAASSGGPPSL